MTRAKLVVTAFVAAGLVSACITKTSQNAIEVTKGASVEERVRWAQSYVTQERFDRLKVQIKQRLPAVTDAQLEGLGLRWNQTNFQSFTGQVSRTTVTIVVGVQYDSSFDPAPIVAAATAILEAEIKATDSSPSSKVEP